MLQHKKKEREIYTIHVYMCEFKTYRKERNKETTAGFLNLLHRLLKLLIQTGPGNTGNLGSNKEINPKWHIPLKC